MLQGKRHASGLRGMLAEWHDLATFPLDLSLFAKSSAENDVVCTLKAEGPSPLSLKVCMGVWRMGHEGMHACYHHALHALMPSFALPFCECSNTCDLQHDNSPPAVRHVVCSAWHLGWQHCSVCFHDRMVK